MGHLGDILRQVIVEEPIITDLALKSICLIHVDLRSWEKIVIKTSSFIVWPFWRGLSLRFNQQNELQQFPPSPLQWWNNEEWEVCRNHATRASLTSLRPCGNVGKYKLMINSFMGIQNTVGAVEWAGDYRMPPFVKNIQIVFGDLPTASLSWL